MPQHNQQRRRAQAGPHLSERTGGSLSVALIPAAVGLAISAYLFGLDLFGASAVCFAQSGCDTVRLSVYGTIFGIHVSAIGVFFFAAVFALCLTRAPWRDRWLQPLAAAGAGAALVFAALQFSVIHAVCPYCLVTDAAALVLAYLVMKPRRVWPFGSAASFGSPGSGGSLGFADPTAGIGYAYVTSQMGTRLAGDPRDLALREAIYSAIQRP